MNWERIKVKWKRLWGKSLDELISGNPAKYKELVGVSWLNIHRLYDFRRWRFLRFRFYLWRKERAMFGGKNLPLS